jgi:hypothetical protein
MGVVLVEGLHEMEQLIVPLVHPRFAALVFRLCKLVDLALSIRVLGVPPTFSNIISVRASEIPNWFPCFRLWKMWPSKSNSYSPLYSNDESEQIITLEKDDIHASETGRWKYIPQTRASKIGTALLTSILIFLILLTLSLLGSRNMRYDCGHSPAEAVAKNCHFDMLAFAWVPIPCYDAE